MPYKYNPFTNNFDDSTTGPAGSVSAAGSGTAAAPGIAFASDTNTGIFNPAADTLAFAEGGVEAMRIDSSGRVGIGTSAPGSIFEAKGSSPQLFVNSASAGYPGLAFQTNGVSDGAILYNGIDDRLEVYTADTSGNPQAVVDSSGRLLVGLTSGSYQLQLSTDSAGKPSTSLWTITSDERIKEDIELADLDLCYEAIKAIPLKRYKWRDDVYSKEQVTDRRKLGWIAQDVETVFPKAVNIHEFKYNQVYETVTVPEVLEELDDEGNVIKTAVPEHTKQELVSEETIADCKDLNADQIYAAMYGAIQKLIIKFEAFEERLDAAGIK